MDQIQNNMAMLLIWLLLFALITTFFTGFTYCALPVITNNDTKDGSRSLTAAEINHEYIEFSRKENIDARSELLLIAGDLSFLGNVPKISSIRYKWQQKNCTKCLDSLKTRKSLSRCKCSSSHKNECIIKSGQFIQLTELQKMNITIHIICQHPEQNGDELYKSRLGCLMDIFGDSLEIHFLNKDTLGNDICVLGRIKRYAYEDELFWHWKSQEKPGRYTVPASKKATASGENKTLIFLLKNVLWNSAPEMSGEEKEEYLSVYQSFIRTNQEGK